MYIVVSIFNFFTAAELKLFDVIFSVISHALGNALVLSNDLLSPECGQTL